MSQWYQKHIKDPYVKQANKAGLRSRAVFKLDEIQQKHHLVRKGDNVADLGSAPGAWSEFLVKAVGPHGKVIACDLLEMAPIQGVTFIQGDFCDEAIQSKMMLSQKFDVIVSDMAPNLTGIKLVDQTNMESLIESVHAFCQQGLKLDGSLVTKCFHGGEFESLYKSFKKEFKKVKVIKPQSSKKESKETYLIGIGYSGDQNRRLDSE